MQWTLDGGAAIELRTPNELSEVLKSHALPARLAHEAASPTACKAEPQEGFLFGTLLVPAKGAAAGEHLREHAGALRATFFFFPERLVFFDLNGRLEALLPELIDSRKNSQPTLEQLFYDLLEALIDEDPAFAHKIEEHISNLEDQILEGEAESIDLNRKIAPIRRRLLFLSRYYDQLVNLGQELQENENGLFTEEGTRRFRMFTERAHRLYDHIQFLRDYSIQLREIYQSQIDLRQNTIMKLLTVVTTICLPLTIIVGWYGMNFVMPELQWRGGYLYVIVLSLAVLGLVIWYFKKKKFL